MVSYDRAYSWSFAPTDPILNTLQTRFSQSKLQRSDSKRLSKKGCNPEKMVWYLLLNCKQFPHSCLGSSESCIWGRQALSAVKKKQKTNIFICARTNAPHVGGKTWKLCDINLKFLIRSISFYEGLHLCSSQKKQRKTYKNDIIKLIKKYK